MRLFAEVRHTSIPKHQLVALLSEKSGETAPPFHTSAKHSVVPSSNSYGNEPLNNVLFDALYFCHLQTIGSKGQLVLRTFKNHSICVCHNKEGQLRDKQLFRLLSFSSRVYQKRKYTVYSVKGQKSKFIPQHGHVHSDEDMKLFKPFLDYLDSQQKAEEDSDTIVKNK